VKNCVLKCRQVCQTKFCGFATPKARDKKLEAARENRKLKRQQQLAFVA